MHQSPDRGHEQGGRYTMAGYVADNYTDQSGPDFAKIDEIVLITAGLIAIAADSRDIQARHVRCVLRQQVLLHFPCDSERFPDPGVIFQSRYHRIKGLAKALKFIAAVDLDLHVEVPLCNQINSFRKAFYRGRNRA